MFSLFLFCRRYQYRHLLAFEEGHLVYLAVLFKLVGKFQKHYLALLLEQYLTTFEKYVCTYLVAVASILLGHGVRNVMISLGSEGVYYDNGTERGIIPSMAYEVINTSGCGDTFLSGTIKGYLNGGSIKDMARYGSAAAAICAASEDTVAPGLSPEKLFEILDRHSM